MYVGVALMLTAGPVLVGLWSGVVGYLLTSCPAGEIVDRCVGLVGLAPFIGLGMVLLAVPAAWVLLLDTRKRYWRVVDQGIDVVEGMRTERRIPWSDIDCIRVGANGPLILMRDRSSDGEQLLFVAREDSVKLHRLWVQQAAKGNVA